MVIQIDELEKAYSREGLVPVRKQVTRKGRTFEQTFWVTPKDLSKMHIESSAKFLESAVKAQQHIKSMLDASEKYLPGMAAAVRVQVEAVGKKVTTIAGLELAIAEHSKRDPVSGVAVMAAIHSRSEAVIPQHIKNVIDRLVKDITTTTFGETLKLGGTTVGVVRTTTAQKMHVWKPTEWASHLKDIVGKKVEQIKGKLAMRRTATLAAKEEAKKPIPAVVRQATRMVTAKKPEFKVTPGTAEEGRQPKMVIRAPITMTRPVQVSAGAPARPAPTVAQATQMKELTSAKLKARMKAEGFHDTIRSDYIRMTGKILPKNRVEALRIVEAELGLKRKAKKKKGLL